MTPQELKDLQEYHIVYNALPESVQYAIALEELKKRGYVE